MNGDALSDLLRAVRLRGAVFHYVEEDPPLVAEAPRVREIIPAVMPGAEHMIELHGVVEGACWGRIAGEPGAWRKGEEQRGHDQTIAAAAELGGAFLGREVSKGAPPRLQRSTRFRAAT